MLDPHPTKNKILTAALYLANRSGIGQLGLTSIAEKADLSKQNLYYHFPDVDNIFLALAQKWFEIGQRITLKHLADTHYSGANKVLAMAEAVYQFIEFDHEIARFGLVLYQSGHLVEGVKKMTEQGVHAGRSRIQSMLTNDASLSLGKATNLDQLVTEIHSLMYGSFFYIVSMTDFKNLEQHKQSTLKHLKAVLSNVSKKR